VTIVRQKGEMIGKPQRSIFKRVFSGLGRFAEDEGLDIGSGSRSRGLFGNGTFVRSL
jgi:hypothetical protein